MSVPESSATAEMRAWLAKYTPVEQAIFAARERRMANAARRRDERRRRFGDLCEATGGLAVRWRRDNTPLAAQLAWAAGDVFTVACVMRAQATRYTEAVRHALKRSLYYEAENARRRALAAERRRIRQRTTENPCPSREVILEAWIHRRDSHDAAIRFGSLIEDLECYLDNSLRFNEDGAIVGRNGGIKRWLQTEIPALYLRYTTVMRFKAAARKLRQLSDIDDPIPAVRIVETPTSEDAAIAASANPSESYAGKTPKDLHVARTQAGELSKARTTPSSPRDPGQCSAVLLLRAHATWLALTSDLAPNVTALFARLEDLLSPM